MSLKVSIWIGFFFNDTATTEIYTLSLHDALPICAALEDVHQRVSLVEQEPARVAQQERVRRVHHVRRGEPRSEEHTSELQSRQYLVCRLLLEKKNKNNTYQTSSTPNTTTPRVTL